jgi:hypothetical protein
MELPEVVAVGIATTLKWLIYTALLWVMIKIQKLNYNVAGLFASSLLSVLVNLIPFVGPYLSYVVLVICLWKCTGADIAPDIVFTVGIAGALMFCVNLWIIGMLMGQLRPDFARDAAGANATVMVDEDGDDADEDGAKTVERSPAPAERQGSSQKPMRVAARTSSPATPAPPTAPAPAATPPTITDGSLTVKGVSMGAHPSVLLSDGVQVYTVSRGDSFTVSLPDTGRTRIRCEDITASFVVLRNGRGQLFQLRLP